MIFVKGFLIKKDELLNESGDRYELLYKYLSEEEANLLVKDLDSRGEQYNKVMWVMVDALAIYIMKYDENSSNLCYLKYRFR